MTPPRRSRRLATAPAVVSTVPQPSSALPEETSNSHEKKEANKKRKPPAGATSTKTATSSSDTKPEPAPTHGNKRARRAPAPPKEEKLCCICMNALTRRTSSTVNSCRHEFCFECISEWSNRETTCPLCKQAFTEITRVHPSRQASNTKICVARTQRQPLPQRQPFFRIDEDTDDDDDWTNDEDDEDIIEGFFRRRARYFDPEDDEDDSEDGIFHPFLASFMMFMNSRF